MSKLFSTSEGEYDFRICIPIMMDNGTHCFVEIQDIPNSRVEEIFEEIPLPPMPCYIDSKLSPKSVLHKEKIREAYDDKKAEAKRNRYRKIISESIVNKECFSDNMIEFVRELPISVQKILLNAFLSIHNAMADDIMEDMKLDMLRSNIWEWYKAYKPKEKPPPNITRGLYSLTETMKEFSVKTKREWYSLPAEDRSRMLAFMGAKNVNAVFIEHFYDRKRENDKLKKEFNGATGRKKYNY